MPGWEVEYVTGTVRELHEGSVARLGAPDARRRARVCRPADRALVLGSTQKYEVADAGACAAGGYDVVRRRSGGGAVLVEPAELAWVDIFVPSGDPLWSDDVGQAAWWVGESWAAALSPALAGLRVWKGPMVRRQWSSLVCFGGLGPGEVVLSTGAKVVGVSQRRGRTGALFQSSCLISWEPDKLLSLLALAGHESAEAAAALRGAAAGVGEVFSAEQTVAGFLARLP